MAAGQEFKVTKANMQELMEMYTAAEAEVGNALIEIEQSMTSLTSTWEGSAYNQYRTNHDRLTTVISTQWRPDLLNTRQVISDYLAEVKQRDAQAANEFSFNYLGT